MTSFLRRNHLWILLALSVAIPYVILGESAKPIRDKIGSFLTTQSNEPNPIEGIDDPEVGRLLTRQQQLSTTPKPDDKAGDLTPTVTFEGILRFDISPRWVMQHWPHVSTTRTDGPLDGLRVPVITGTDPKDAVGSLTYYFNAQRQVQRISMDGIIGDERRVVSVVTGRFQLQPEPKPGVGLYVSRWNGKPISALWIRRMPVVDTGDGAARHEFSLELNRPDNYHGLSSRLRKRIENAHASRGPVAVVR
ncbi:MAG: DUF6690 family protein [Planctomycetota bacterium]